MSDTKWSSLRGRRFDFSVIKGGRSEYLIAGVLGVIIIGAAYMIYKGIAGESGPTGPTEVRFWCDPNGTPKGCGYEFTVKVKDLAVAHNSGDELTLMKIHCTKCGAKRTCWQERQCPNCKKWFVPLSTRMHYEALRTGRGDPTGIRDVCPWCNTDLQKWYIDHQPKD